MLRGPSVAVLVWVAGLVIATAIGFYASYFSRVPRFEGSGWQVHFHLLSLVAWLGMLATQAWAAWAGRDATHRRLGRLSYLLVPLIVLGFVLVTDFGQRRAKQSDLLGAALFDGSLFLACYLLAVRARRRPSYHSRYMMLTALALMNAPVGRAVSPEFSVTLQAVLLLGVLLLARGRGRVWQPYAVVSAVYAGLLVAVLSVTVVAPQVLEDFWQAVWG